MNYDRKIQTERLLFDRFRIVLHSINRLKSYESNKLHCCMAHFLMYDFFTRSHPPLTFLKIKGVYMR